MLCSRRLLAARVAARGLCLGAGGLCVGAGGLGGVLALCAGLSRDRFVQGAGAVSVCPYTYVQT